MNAFEEQLEHLVFEVSADINPLERAKVLSEAAQALIEMYMDCPAIWLEEEDFDCDCEFADQDGGTEE